jgi:N6-L-threonylcarbamoyladenine synthase
MPCFLAGESQARVLGSTLGIPVYSNSHQQMHVAASLFSADAMDLMDTPHLAWHLSGGTTELLYVTPEGASVHCEKIGGTTDISAGQLIDRTGKLLGLSFPSGREIDRLSTEATGKDSFRVKVNGMEFSLSGVQNKVEQYHKGSNAETAAYALRSVIGAIITASENALKQYPKCKIVFAGGVSSNSMLRKRCKHLPAVFCEPEFSRDNALGTAILAWRKHHEAYL